MNASATSTASAGRHRRAARPILRGHRRGSRLLTGLLVLLVALVVLAAPAAAFWRSTGSGIGSAATATLTAPTSVTVAPTSLPNVAVNWPASTSPPTPTGYYITRTRAGVTAAACATSITSTIAGTTCTDTSVPSGTYTYTVTAVYRSWTAVSSPSGSVVVWTPSKVAFTVQPANATAGVAITPSIAVTVEDASGTAVPVAGIAVIVSIGVNAGGGTLSGTLTGSTNSSGVTSFAGVSINKAASGYTLAAASIGLTSATSSTFIISAAAASRFVITSAAVSGAASASATLGAVTVHEQDAFGNPTIAPVGGTIVNLASNSAGTRIFSATSGGSSITTMTISAGSTSASFYYGDTRAGSPTITVSGSLTSGTQLETITAGTAALLAFGQQPTNAAASQTIAPAITAVIEDQFGNLTTSTVAVTIAIAHNAGGLLPGTLYGTKTVQASAGIATFSGLSIDGAVLGLGGNGNGYTLKVTSGALTSATSIAFNIT